MSGAAYVVRMLLMFAVIVIAMFASYVPLAAIHPHWDHDRDVCEPLGALFGMMFCGGCATLIMLLSLAPLAISVLIAVWIYYDARKRNDPNAVAWAILGFLLNIIGWIVYLIVRSETQTVTAGPPSPSA